MRVRFEVTMSQTQSKNKHNYAGIASVVEHNLSKLGSAEFRISFPAQIYIVSGVYYVILICATRQGCG